MSVFEKPQKKRKHLCGRINRTIGFKIQSSSRHCYKLTDSLLALDWIWDTVKDTQTLEWRVSSPIVPRCPDKHSGSRRRASSSKWQLWITLSKLAPQLWFQYLEYPPNHTGWMSGARRGGGRNKSLLSPQTHIFWLVAHPNSWRHADLKRTTSGTLSEWPVKSLA